MDWLIVCCPSVFAFLLFTEKLLIAKKEEKKLSIPGQVFSLESKSQECSDNKLWCDVKAATVLDIP